jgi:hypothetical protein
MFKKFLLKIAEAFFTTNNIIGSVTHTYTHILKYIYIYIFEQSNFQTFD